MKKTNSIGLLSVVVLAFILSGCELVEVIFEAGFWTAIIGVVLVIALIIWLIRRFAK